MSRTYRRIKIQPSSCEGWLTFKLKYDWETLGRMDDISYKKVALFYSDKYRPNFHKKYMIKQLRKTDRSRAKLLLKLGRDVDIFYHPRQHEHYYA